MRTISLITLEPSEPGEGLVGSGSPVRLFLFKTLQPDGCNNPLTGPSRTELSPLRLVDLLIAPEPSTDSDFVVLQAAGQLCHSAAVKLMMHVDGSADLYL